LQGDRSERSRLLRLFKKRRIVLSQLWLALMIGNSRLHWAQFAAAQLQQTWNTPHWSAATIQAWIEQGFDLQPFVPDLEFSRSRLIEPPELWLASVVPTQTALWQTYPQLRLLTLAQVPIANLYPTLGIDRALAAWGAVTTQGCPVLVIDAGTALTFTGIDGNACLVGGAILPGLALQFRSLDRGTAALPEVQPHATLALPFRWATNTEAAIASGVIYTLLAGIQSFGENWLQRFPASSIVLTGGDGERCYQLLQQLVPHLAAHLAIEPNLIFWGMQAIRAGA
jgi:type III pantothenate kinase